MGQSFLRAFLITAALVVLNAGIAKADDAVRSTSDVLPRLEVAKEYKLPPSPTATGLAAVYVGDAPTAVAWSPDGKELAAFSSYGQNLTVWNVNGDVIKVLHPVINYLHNSLAFLNNDELLTQSENTRVIPANAHLAFDIWNIPKGAVTKRIDGPEPNKNWGPNTPETYTLSPDGSMAVMLAQQTGTAKLGPEQEFKENPVPIYSTKTWEVVQRLPIVWPTAVTFSPDGKQIAFGFSGGKLSLYDTATWKLIKKITMCEGFSPQVESIAYSPDSKFIVAGMGVTPNPCQERIIRIADGTVVGTYPDTKAGSPRKILWHSSGKFIVFTARDGTLRVWNPEKPDDAGTIIHKVSSMCLAFSPDSSQLAACNSNHQAITVFNITF